jgi:hypothetical protein
MTVYKMILAIISYDRSALAPAAYAERLWQRRPFCSTFWASKSGLNPAKGKKSINKLKLQLFHE